VAKRKAKGVDPFRRRGDRGLTRRWLQRFAIEHVVLQELLRKGALSAPELERLCHPFRPAAILKWARWHGLQARAGRRGGFEVVDRAAFRRWVDVVEQRLSAYTGPESAAIIAAELARAPGAAESGDAEHASSEPRGAFAPFRRSPGADWQQSAVGFLASRFSSEELVGFLPAAFRAEWYMARGSREGSGLETAEEIAEALVRLHDTDLLANAVALRHRIAGEIGVERLARFHPGSATAAAFVERAGLPRELAGEPDGQRPQSIVHLTSVDGPSRCPLPDLVDYQTTGKNEMLTVMHDAGAAIYSVPTGAGKTRTAWEAIRDFVSERSVGERNVILWLAHRNELLNQACACLNDVWRSRDGNESLMLIRLWGRSTRDALTRLERVDLPEPLARATPTCVVIVSTPATMAAVLGKLDHAPPLRQTIIDRTRAIVVDEAHRAAAPSYVRIARWLRPLNATNEAHQKVTLLGLTATPFRKTFSATAGTLETLELKEIFGRLIVPAELGSDPQRRLVERGILARPVFEDLPTGVELNIQAGVKRLFAKGVKGSSLSAGREELIDRWLARKASLAVRSPERHARVFRIVLERAQDPNARMLYFGQSVANAQLMCVSLVQAGIPAAVVSGATRAWTRRRLIDEFRAGRIRVLCNCEVLTAGFDAPLVTHVAVARPTVSLVLYQQMIGRGLRGPRFGGTEQCVIVNCIDRVKMGPLVLAHRRFRELWDEGA